MSYGRFPIPRGVFPSPATSLFEVARGYLCPSVELRRGRANADSTPPPGNVILRVSVRGHPGPGFALGHRDLDVGHHLGDLAAERNGFDAAFQGG
jgi:hypothetical protein